MSTTTTIVSLGQWIEDFRCEVAAPEIHPVDCCAKKMQEVVARDAEEVKPLVRIVQGQGRRRTTLGGSEA